MVVKVGEEYNWSSTFDGVTLWGVEQSSVINLAGGTDKLKTVIYNTLEYTNKCFSNSLIPLRRTMHRSFGGHRPLFQVCVLKSSGNIPQSI